MRAILSIAIVGIAAAIALALTYAWAQPLILKNQAEHANEQIAALLPELEDHSLERLCANGFELYEASVVGYGGEIDVIAVFQDAQIYGIRVVRHAETPGFSDILEPEDWLGTFAKRPPESVDAVSRVTITSNAILRAVSQLVALDQARTTSC